MVTFYYINITYLNSNVIISAVQLFTMLNSPGFPLNQQENFSPMCFYCSVVHEKQDLNFCFYIYFSKRNFHMLT